MNTRSARAGALLLTAMLAFAARAQEASPPSAPDTPSASAEAGNSAWHSSGFWKEAIRFSGFARLIGGYLDEERATYLDYDDSIDFGQHSLFALQADVDFSEQFSFTTQLLAHTSHRRDSGLEWAYLSYRPTKNWQFKAGKLRAPFFMHSDTLDVGFAYPWIAPPQQVYVPYLFPDYTGLSAAWQYNIQDWGIEAEAYWGRFDGDVTVGGAQLGVKVDDLSGLVLELQRGNLRLRASYHRGDMEGSSSLPRTTAFARQLRGLGFERSANSLNPDGAFSFFQAAVSYDELDYFLKAEWMTIDSEAPAIFRRDGYYLSGGYTFHPITVHATFAELRAATLRPIDEIPAGVSQLNRLRSTYTRAFNIFARNDNLQSLSVGLRWDLNPSLALKAEWLHLDGERNQRSFFNFDPAADFDRKANLFLFAVEWIF